MNRTKRFFTMTCIGTGLVLGLAANALADDDDWGGVFLGVFPGIQIYSPPAYVVEQPPPPPPPPGAYVYYGQPGPQDGYYYRHYRHGRDWREHRHHERHEDDDD